MTPSSVGWKLAMSSAPVAVPPPDAPAHSIPPLPNVASLPAETIWNPVGLAYRVVVSWNGATEGVHCGVHEPSDLLLGLSPTAGWYGPSLAVAVSASTPLEANSA